MTYAANILLLIDHVLCQFRDRVEFVSVTSDSDFLPFSLRMALSKSEKKPESSGSIILDDLVFRRIKYRLPINNSRYLH
jgi:hypothetical protein